MVTRSLIDTRAWAELGNQLILKAAKGLTDDDLRAPSSLPGWSVGNLVAHIAANGDALLNLVTWAKTGVETPMYSSPAARATGIGRGDTLTAAEAQAWLADSSTRLAEGFDALTHEQWHIQVVTAHGRTVPATELPYMRSREALIHSVDLSASIGHAIGFADLPEAFLGTLIDDIAHTRGLALVTLPAGPKPDVAAWLAGRRHVLTDAPEIGAWL